MLQVPAIVGMEPFQVWQVIRELHALLFKLGTPYAGRNDMVTLAGFTLIGFPLEILLDKRQDPA